MHEVLVNRLGGLSLPRKSVVRLTDRPDMTLDVYRGRKTTMQCNIVLWPKGQLCVCGGGGGGGVQRPLGMTGISAILFNLNNFTVSNKT